MFNSQKLIEQASGAKDKVEIISVDLSLAEGVILLLTSSNQLYLLNSQFIIREIKVDASVKKDAY